MCIPRPLRCILYRFYPCVMTDGSAFSHARLPDLLDTTNDGDFFHGEIKGGIRKYVYTYIAQFCTVE